jgi:glucose/arabinose dehydrogenase
MVVTPRLARAVEVPPGFIAETIATNLNAATAIAPAPDGRLFIADQTGKLLVWKAGRVLDTPALTLRVTDCWERGLIGVTLDPEFPRAPHLPLLYVTDRPFVHHVLSRFMVEGDRIDPASEKILLEGDDLAKLGGSVPAGHQGGALRFGSDGKLYVSIGEQTAGEPSQRLDTLQGKILRLNRDGSIPEDNPFLAQATGKYRAIFARGVRNSFGLAAQLNADGGRMFFTDVGGSAFEEVNELKAGANYGWPRAEGFSTNAAFTNPLHAYPPMIGQSIVGGSFAPSSKLKLAGEMARQVPLRRLQEALDQSPRSRRADQRAYFRARTARPRRHRTCARRFAARAQPRRRLARPETIRNARSFGCAT